MAARPGRVEEVKVVETARPRDPTDPAMVRLAAEVKRWLRRQVSDDRQPEDAAARSPDRAG